jgi:hypothetical protein
VGGVEMMRVFSAETCQVFSGRRYRSVLFKDKADDFPYEGFSRVRGGEKFCNLSHRSMNVNFSFWFHDYFEYSSVFASDSENWGWVCENILFGVGWREMLN